MNRQATIERKTNETNISITTNLDGVGKFDITTSVPFFDHMLSQLAKHSLIDLEVKATGDIEVDYHHTVEDVGISFGEAVLKALGDKRGIKRFGFASIPMNETLAEVSLDISGRSYIVFDANFAKSKIGEFDVELAEEFFRAFANAANITLHIGVKSGTNLHHMVEAMFKALAIALRSAIAIDPRVSDQIQSTKGQL
ncbi:MAG: imidazoleglycerol-phosphate dehydratase HisB [Nitrospinota bacterium]